MTSGREFIHNPYLAFSCINNLALIFGYLSKISSRRASHPCTKPLPLISPISPQVALFSEPTYYTNFTHVTNRFLQKVKGSTEEPLSARMGDIIVARTGGNLYYAERNERLFLDLSTKNKSRVKCISWIWYWHHTYLLQSHAIISLDSGKVFSHILSLILSVRYLLCMYGICDV